MNKCEMDRDKCLKQIKINQIPIDNCLPKSKI